MQLHQTQPSTRLQSQFVPRLSRQSLSAKSAHRFAGTALIATALLSCATMAQAQSAANASRNTGNDYIGFNAGSSDLARPIAGFGVLGGGQQTNVYSLSAGHYFADRNYGIEVGYTDFGSVSRSGGSTKVDGINVSLIGRAPLGQSFNLLGKIGATYGRTDVSSSAASGVQAGSERGFDVSYGLGGEYLINPNWSALLAYDEHYVKYPGNRERASATTLGLRYRY
jgi:hypothetical protein